MHLQLYLKKEDLQPLQAMRVALLRHLSQMRKQLRQYYRQQKRLDISRAGILGLQWMQLLQSGRVRKERVITSFLRLEQSIQQRSLLSTGLNYVRSILLYLLKMVLMKRTGKAGRSLQTDLEIRFSLQVMIFLLLIQRDSLRELNLEQVMQFLSSLIRLVQFQRHLKLSRWLIKQDIQQSAHTDQVRQQIQQQQTSLLLLTLARLRQVLLQDQKELLSITSF